MDGGDDDFSLIMKGYICTKCENYLSQNKLPMYSVAILDFGLLSRHIPEQLHPIELLLIARHWPLAITLKLSHGGSGTDGMIGHCISLLKEIQSHFSQSFQVLTMISSTTLLLHSWDAVTCQKMLQHSCAMSQQLMFDQSLLLCI